ncbi:hypothetical protein BBV17_00375 [Cytobacillus oceanisediminis]|uniref:Uncharacterized protein n=1 Tax=Cytobacillus oceanisediminis TaxID=665099 RepID=A0ABX3CVX2_9BACI|nr:hypothetical protein BBV17_00375 [Cytobacillus oceanisediminis]
MPVVVRTQGKFGQKSEKKAQVCPNPGQVRSGKAGKVQSSVRTRGKFGQERQKKSRVCPNLRQVWTGKAEKGPSLSEPEASSDREGRKSPESVRTRGKFGQERQKKSRVCPNLRQVWTGKAGKVQSLSESRASSDRKDRKSPESVRTRARLGQERQEKSRVCPNLRQVRTGKAEKVQSLSKPGASSVKITQETA